MTRPSLVLPTNWPEWQNRAFFVRAPRPTKPQNTRMVGRTRLVGTGGASLNTAHDIESAFGVPRHERFWVFEHRETRGTQARRGSPGGVDAILLITLLVDTPINYFLHVDVERKQAYMTTLDRFVRWGARRSIVDPARVRYELADADWTWVGEPFTDDPLANGRPGVANYTTRDGTPYLAGFPEDSDVQSALRARELRTFRRGVPGAQPVWSTTTGERTTRTATEIEAGLTRSGVLTPPVPEASAMRDTWVIPPDAGAREARDAKIDALVRRGPLSESHLFTVVRSNRGMTGLREGIGVSVADAARDAISAAKQEWRETMAYATDEQRRNMEPKNAIHYDRCPCKVPPLPPVSSDILYR